VFPVLCLCWTVGTDVPLIPDSSVPRSALGIRATGWNLESGGQSQQLLVCLLPLREGAGLTRWNPVYLSWRRGQLLREKKTLDYNGA
jgi:hypothetical protein